MLLAQTASLPQPVPPRKEKEADGGRKRLSEMLEIPQASVFNGKPAQEKAPDTVQRRRKAHAVQSILAAHRDSLRAARMEQETEGQSRAAPAA